MLHELFLYIQPSATHSDNLIEKTQVDMSWQAPSRKPERTSVTVWYVRNLGFYYD